MTSLDPDTFLHLRRGERDAFVRYFESYRGSVYGLSRALLASEDEAVAATHDAFTIAYHRLLLAEGRVEPKAWAFSAAVEVCRERLSGDDREAPIADSAGRETNELARRFFQALETTPFTQRAALLFHDIGGLCPAELATVFNVTEDAVSVLLFRARAAFREAFEVLSADQRLASCRLAEQMAAGAVGGSLSDAERHRLDDHAAYCSDCRRTIDAWAATPYGLALCLTSAPLPEALETAPVFGTVVPVSGAAAPAAAAGALGGALARIRRVAAGRAAAYAVAAVCLVLAAGMAAAHPWDGRTVVVVSSAWVPGPALGATARVAVPVAGTSPTAETSPVPAVAGVSSAADGSVAWIPPTAAAKDPRVAPTSVAVSPARTNRRADRPASPGATALTTTKSAAKAGNGRARSAASPSDTRSAHAAAAAVRHTAPGHGRPTTMPKKKKHTAKNH